MNPISIFHYHDYYYQLFNIIELFIIAMQVGQYTEWLLLNCLVSYS